MPIGSDGLVGYEIEANIGAGGFATVYRARDLAHGRRVAIKVISSELDETERRRFDRERQAIGQLADHPNVVPVFDSGVTAQGEAYLILEYAPGGSLADRLGSKGPFPWSDAVDIIDAIGGAVEAAHAVGIRHRDIKPENILVSHYGAVKLTDFGIASVATSTTTTTSASVTLAHSPPELLEGAEPTDMADVYSLASTFHHLVAGRRPFHRDGDTDIRAPSPASSLSVHLRCAPTVFRGQSMRSSPTLWPRCRPIGICRWSSSDRRSRVLPAQLGRAARPGRPWGSSQRLLRWRLLGSRLCRCPRRRRPVSPSRERGPRRRVGLGRWL